MPKLLEKKKKCKGENGKGKRISEKAPPFRFSRRLFILLSLGHACCQKKVFNTYVDIGPNGSSSLRSVACAHKVGEWCDVRHTMCDARHRGVRGVTLVTASVTLVTDATPVFLYFGLGFAVWFVFFSFCTPFPPLPNKPLSYYH